MQENVDQSSFGFTKETSEWERNESEDDRPEIIILNVIAKYCIQ